MAFNLCALYLNLKVAQDVEFLDREEGMNQMEFNRFASRIPSRLQPKFESLLKQEKYRSIMQTFERDCEGAVSADQIQKLIDDLTANETVSNVSG